MYEFLDRLISLAIPRVKDFRGLNPNGFDKNGNYNFGFTEQTVFPEVDAAAVTFQQGMNITMVTTASNADEGRELLKQFGFPFRDRSEETGDNNGRDRVPTGRQQLEQSSRRGKQHGNQSLDQQNRSVAKRWSSSYAEIRRQLKKEKNFAALAKLPRDSSPTRSHNRCQLTGRSRGRAAEVQGLPHHAPRAGPGGQDPGAEEGELVSAEVVSGQLSIAVKSDATRSGLSN